jgi:hypothetical protein
MNAGRTRPHGADDPVVAELATDCLTFAKTCYTKDGRPTGEVSPLFLPLISVISTGMPKSKCVCGRQA